MPTGPKGQKRPADVVSNAVHVMRVLTGEEDESPTTDDGKNKAQHRIAAAFNVNPGRVNEVLKGHKHPGARDIAQQS